MQSLKLEIGFTTKITERAKAAMFALGFPESDWECINALATATEIVNSAILSTPVELGLITNRRAWDLSSAALKLLVELERKAEPPPSPIPSPA